MTNLEKNNKVLSGILALSGEQVFKIALGLLSNIIIVRFLSPEDLGVLSYILSFSIIVSHFTTFGTHEPTIERLSLGPEKHEVTMGSSTLTKGIGSLLGIVIFTPILFFSDSNLKIKLYILFLLISQSFKVFDTIFEYLLSILNLKKTAIYRTYLSSGLTIARATFVFLTRSWEVVIWLVYLEMALLSITYILIYSKGEKSVLKWEVQKPVVISILKKSFPIFILTLSTFAIIRTDQLMISYFLSFTENGFYSISSRLIEAILFLPITISVVYYPAIIEKKHKSEKREKAKEMYGILFSIALLQILFFTIASPILIPFLFGEQYRPAIVPFQINVWSLIFIYWNLGRLKVAPTFNSQWSHISVLMSSLVLNVGLNWFLIPRLGLIGASFSTIIAPITSILIFSIINPQIRKDSILFLGSPKKAISLLFKKS